MDKPTIKRSMRIKLRKLKGGEWSHQQAIAALGLEIAIRDLAFYMEHIGMIYDWKQKVWRAKKPPGNPYLRSMTKLQGIIDNHGLKFTTDQLFNGGIRTFEDLRRGSR